MQLNFCGHDVIHGRSSSQHASCSMFDVPLNAHVSMLELEKNGGVLVRFRLNTL